jgi:hypothetical protein
LADTGQLILGLTAFLAAIEPEGARSRTMGLQSPKSVLVSAEAALDKDDIQTAPVILLLERVQDEKAQI